MSSQPKFQAQTTNQSLGNLNNQAQALGSGSSGVEAQKALFNYGSGYGDGNISSREAIQEYTNAMGGLDSDHQDLAGETQAFENQLATGATTGTKYAQEQMAANPTQAGLYGEKGQLGNTEGLINQEQNQGFYLQPQDQTLYGQESGQIANQFGQQANQTASSLAARGLSSSGAAGAAFSGIAGSQNEMLARAQQDIAQQRFQNTQQQISQNQNYAAQLGNQYNSALQQQYGRQLAGAQNETNTLNEAGQTSNQNNQVYNSGNAASSATEGPGLAGIGEGLAVQGASSFADGVGSGAAGSLFSGGAGGKTTTTGAGK